MLYSQPSRDYFRLAVGIVSSFLNLEVSFIFKYLLDLGVSHAKDLAHERNSTW